jgi:Txe/YoeB family toxin of Txe-Axe toxin-antitoxin module
VLQGNGIEHVQLREYAIRRVNAENFRLVYHPEMCSAVELMEENAAGWFQFYFAPEQLGNFTSALPNSCVFSLAAMVLTIMNPLDSKRDIYSQDKFELNPKVIEEKLKNAGSGFYSNRLVDIVRFGLTP